MRDLLVLLLFSYGAIRALKSPYYGALLWVWIGVMNPHRLGWGFAYSMPFALAAVAITGVSMFAHAREVRWPKGAPITILILMVIWMGLTTALAIHPADSMSVYVDVLKVMLMVVVTAAVVRTREQIVGLIGVLVISIGYFGAKGGIFTLSTGGNQRVWGPPASPIEGNNELAVALIITIPLIYYLIQQSELILKLPALQKLGKTWLKRLLFVLIGLCALAAIGSQSRGAFLAISAMSAVLWWRSKSKLTIGIVLLIMAPAVLLFMPEGWTERMNTIQTYEQDESAMGRINAWTMAFNIANSRPAGAGFVTDTSFIYQMYAPDPNFVIVAHSIYFQILGQHGYIGLLLYLLFWFQTYRIGGRLMAASRIRPDFEWVGQLGAMFKVSLIGFAVGGAFLSLAYWDLPFYLMVILVTTDLWVKDKLAEPSSSSTVQGARSGADGLRAT
ncbi:putative O-glycosylation ligase, exosortase A system-associated [Zoogloea sp.]|uniref:putative O-glycosylation ligase, exosortase A system-associated n=1 Tax=Zoogloea sp. TaxID=49181 RepID=UPI00260D1B50|nr:putative O-glycosylation ligase, exosortase A system-associated [Zoogloea sp.]MDD3352545.1 putative O-glycosylation ligase, exosortase A system-associated [Zoogloea sp.]